MATIVPFRGTLYNQDKIENIADVTTQPYDIISKQDQQNYYKQNPYNIIRLILGKPAQKDKNNDWHSDAASLLNKWRSEKILVEDKSPAFYLTSTDFTLENKIVTRYGLIALVRLEPFDKGIIRPHEKTFSNISAERFELIKTCHANFSPIFSLYSDQNIIMNSLKNSVGNKKPDMNFTDKDEMKHKLWRITDSSIHNYVAEAMKEKTLFIADGHHRYETALNYKNWVSGKTPDFNHNHPANYVMMYLCSMEDPGLIILPAHRILKGINDLMLDSFIQLSENYFNIEKIPFKGKETGEAGSKLTSGLKANSSKNAIGVFIRNRSEFYLMTLKPNAMEAVINEDLADSLKTLDVTVLTHLVLMKILGFNQSMLNNEDLIVYSSSEEKAIQYVASGKCDIAFILNPTKIKQIRKIAGQGLIMPRKSTYFHPKAITGQVINMLTN